MSSTDVTELLAGSAAAGADAREERALVRVRLEPRGPGRTVPGPALPTSRPVRRRGRSRSRGSASRSRRAGSRAGRSRNRRPRPASGRGSRSPGASRCRSASCTYRRRRSGRRCRAGCPGCSSGSRTPAAGVGEAAVEMVVATVGPVRPHLELRQRAAPVREPEVPDAASRRRSSASSAASSAAPSRCRRAPCRPVRATRAAVRRSAGSRRRGCSCLRTGG